MLSRRRAAARGGWRSGLVELQRWQLGVARRVSRRRAALARAPCLVRQPPSRRPGGPPLPPAPGGRGGRSDRRGGELSGELGAVVGQGIDGHAVLAQSRGAQSRRPRSGPVRWGASSGSLTRRRRRSAASGQLGSGPVGGGDDGRGQLAGLVGHAGRAAAGPPRCGRRRRVRRSVRRRRRGRPPAASRGWRAGGGSPPASASSPRRANHVKLGDGVARYSHRGARAPAPPRPLPAPWHSSATAASCRGPRSPVGEAAEGIEHGAVVGAVEQALLLDLASSHRQRLAPMRPEQGGADGLVVDLSAAAGRRRRAGGGG